MDHKFNCFICKNEIAVWHSIVSDKDENIEKTFFCDNCVPRGCSCNNESMFYRDDENDLDELDHQAQVLRDLVNKNNYIMLNYGKIEKHCGKELETITDMKKIRLIVNNVTNTQLRHFLFKPLDDKNREYPCCEFDYEKDGFIVKDFINE